MRIHATAFEREFPDEIPYQCRAHVDRAGMLAYQVRIGLEAFCISAIRTGYRMGQNAGPERIKHRSTYIDIIARRSGEASVRSAMDEMRMPGL